MTIPTPKARPRELFHYCPLAAFLGIIFSKSLWLTDSSRTNDASENSHSFEVICTTLKTLVADGVLAENVARTQFEDLRGFRAHPYMASLSEDGDLLSQWVMYADGGKGVALGLLVDGLEVEFGAPLWQRSGSSRIASPEGGRRLFRVLYEATEKEELVREASRSTSDIVLPLVSASYQIKHGAFRAEREWRILDRIHGVQNHEGGAEVARPKPKRSAEGLLYTRFSLGQSVASVRRGPRCPMGQDTLRTFLNVQGLQQTRDLRSDVPYR